MTTSIAYFVEGNLVLDEEAITSRFQVFNLLFSSVQSAAGATFRQLLMELLELYITMTLGRAKYERRDKSDRTMIPWCCNKCGSQMRAHFVRNGHYQRGIATTWGYVARIQIPMIRCVRCGGYVDLPFPFLPKYVRIWDDLMRQIMLDSTLGLSLRRQQQRQAEIGQPVLGLKAINRQVRLVVKALPILAGDPLSEVPPLVQFDGIYFTLLERTMQVKRDALRRLRRRLRHRDGVVLVALGIWPDGRHQMLGWTLAESESSAAWRDFLLSLHQRGLTMENGLLLGIGDGAGGLREGLDFVYYGRLPFQLCIFHKIKRIVHRDYLIDRTHREEILQDASYVLTVPDAVQVYARLKSFRQKWQEREPDSVRIFERNFSQCLTYLQVGCPDPIQFARTTSHTERVMRELRRKLSQVGTLITEIGAQATMTLLAARLNGLWTNQPWLNPLMQIVLEAA